MRAAAAVVLVEAGTEIGAHKVGVESREVTLSTSHMILKNLQPWFPVMNHERGSHVLIVTWTTRHKSCHFRMDPAGLPRTILALDVHLLLEAAF